MYESYCAKKGSVIFKIETDEGTTGGCEADVFAAANNLRLLDGPAGAGLYLMGTCRPIRERWLLFLRCGRSR